MAKIELIHVTGNSYFCSGRLSVGVYIVGSRAVLIDSGIDKDHAKDIDKALSAAGYTVGAIINTHHHPDHCGGNAYFQNKYPDCRIAASAFESLFITTPYLQPLCFCGGAQPFNEIRNKFLEVAEVSQITDVITAYLDQTLELCETPFSIITLPGHTHGSIGVISPDGVFYTGDSFFGEETLNKHGALYYTHIGDTLKSFTKLATLAPTATVFYHGGLLNGSIPDSIEHHKQRLMHTVDLVETHIKANTNGCSIDEVTQAVMLAYNIPANPVSWFLTRTNVNAIVTFLSEQKKTTLTMNGALLRAIAA